MRISDWSSDVCSSDLMAATCDQGLERRLGSQCTGLDRRMAALDPRGVQHASLATDHNTAGKAEFGQGQKAAGRQRARAIRDALAALEDRAYGRVSLVRSE